ncbi:MAG: Rieske (2Fe-2S) protein [Polyangiaceae bacterium]|nr:Rieske (2Fe-2S) protein [Polyangiaceae bacterium]
MTDEYRYPFSPYPEGWFAILEASNLAAGEIKTLKYFGRELVAFRDDAGKIRVTAAHCVHQGAHLGHGGKIENGCLRCPFHGWKYNGDGECVEVPYSDSVPKNARIHSYPVLEWANLVIVFYNENNDAPTWTPELPDLSDMLVYGRTAVLARVHIQDVGENGVDIPHFKYVHGQPLPDLVRAEGVGKSFFIETKNKEDSPNYKHVKGINRVLWGMGISSTDFVAKVTGRAIICRTPVDRFHSELSVTAVVPKLPNEGHSIAFGKALLENVSRELDSDIPIWENKLYADDPVLSRGDGPVYKWRRWCKQFYTGKPEGHSPNVTS